MLSYTVNVQFKVLLKYIQMSLDILFFVRQGLCNIMFLKKVSIALRRKFAEVLLA